MGYVTDKNRLSLLLCCNGNKIPRTALCSAGYGMSLCGLAAACLLVSLACSVHRFEFEYGA